LHVRRKRCSLQRGHRYRKQWSKSWLTIPGTARGLYVCKNLVEAMGGAIWVDTTLGSGSRFSYALAIDGSMAKA
jgi:signal transduction histidine kinase